MTCKENVKKKYKLYLKRRKINEKKDIGNNQIKTMKDWENDSDLDSQEY